jgi:hypothetical protein
MKSIILLLSLLAVSNAFSNDKNIGDRAAYNVNFQGIQATTENIVTALNRSSEEYDVKTTTKVRGQVEVTVEKVPTEDLMTKEMANTILANCTFMGGVIETLQLAGAARRTCKIEANADSVLPLVTKSGFQLTNNTNGFIWIGAFPINGIGKLVTEEIEMTLTSMNW